MKGRNANCQFVGELAVYCLVCQRYSTAEAQSNIATRQRNQCGERMSSMSDVAMCDPDKFAWQLFLKIAKPLAVPTPSPDSVPGRTLESN